MSTEPTQPIRHTDPAALRSFGRRNGRPLREMQAELWENLLPKVAFQPESADPCAWAEGKKLWLELGFGGGEHLAALAQQHPDVAMIGCEPFRNGVVKLLGAIEAQHIPNIRIYADDARHVLRALPAGRLERVYILYPDPWPKIRHHKRRVVNAALLDLLAHAVAEGGEVILATDHHGYAQWMLEHFLVDTRFEWQATSMADWQEPPTGWVPTRYEIKCLEGTPPVYLRFVRCNA